MNHLLSNPYGIDKVINLIQEDLYCELQKKWTESISGYGRAYKNLANTGENIPKYYKSSKIIVPEWYNAQKDDYEDVFFDDNFSCVFCFLIKDTDSTEDELVYKSTIKVVFMLDLGRVYPESRERQDARVQKEAVEILRDISYSKYKITGIERGIETIFSEYTTSDIRFDDMHPLHLFSVNIELPYYLEDSCN